MPACTVSTVLSSSTPCLAQDSGIRDWVNDKTRQIPLHLALEMLTRDGGVRTPGKTEKQRPCAWSGP